MVQWLIWLLPVWAVKAGWSGRVDQRRSPDNSLNDCVVCLWWQFQGMQTCYMRITSPKGIAPREILCAVYGGGEYQPRLISLPLVLRTLSLSSHEGAESIPWDNRMIKYVENISEKNGFDHHYKICHWLTKCILQFLFFYWEN